MLFTILSVVVLVVLDQVSKYFATLYLAPIGVAPFLPGIMQLEYVLNDGAAFSLFAGNRWFLIGLTSVALVALAVYLLWKRPASRLELFAWILVLGGGLGNLIDRIRTGVVVDFFSLQFMNFAVFNVADCFVCVGVALLLITVLGQEISAVRRNRAAAQAADESALQETPESQTQAAQPTAETTKQQ